MTDDIPAPGRPNKSALKRAAKTVEELAMQLADLPEAKFLKLSTEPGIHGEIVLARRTTAHSARKRQIKRLAALLRHDEEATAALQAFVDGDSQQQRQETARFHQLEQWRDRLCQADTATAAWEEIHQAFPTLELAPLKALALQVQSRNDRTAARKIFRLLRQADEA